MMSQNNQNSCVRYFFAFCVTALKIKTFLVLPIDCCSPDPGSQANFYGGPKIIVLIWSVCFSEGLSALGSLKVIRKKNQKSSFHFKDSLSYFYSVISQINFS